MALSCIAEQVLYCKPVVSEQSSSVTAKKKKKMVVLLVFTHKPQSVANLKVGPKSYFPKYKIKCLLFNNYLNGNKTVFRFRDAVFAV